MRVKGPFVIVASGNAGLFGEAGPGLVGIARLAAESPLLQAKSKVEYFELPAKSLLNRCSSSNVPFSWTINPYRGCEFGCRYCYARYTHEYMGFDSGRSFEEKIYAKAHAASLLRADLRKPVEGSIAIGTSTDPYQPAERRYGIMRRILEVFAEGQGRRLSITTKSDLIIRDIDLLLAFTRANSLHISITLTTLDAALARKLEPRAPRPELRVGAIRALAGVGLPVGVSASPILPGLTDSVKNLDQLMRAAAGAGAQYLWGGLLFLMPSAQKQFLPFLKSEFPALAPRYRARFARNAYIRGAYAEMIRDRVARLRARYGLTHAPQDYIPAAGLSEQQLELFG